MEDFVCMHCGTVVTGNGYTNHCSECLWSRHVDVSPGDRMSTCKGAMPPVAIEMESDIFVITQRCVVCGHTRRNRMGETDNMETLVRVTKALADEKSK